MVAALDEGGTLILLGECDPECGELRAADHTPVYVREVLRDEHNEVVAPQEPWVRGPALHGDQIRLVSLSHVREIAHGDDSLEEVQHDGYTLTSVGDQALEHGEYVCWRARKGIDGHLSLDRAPRIHSDKATLSHLLVRELNPLRHVVGQHDVL